MPGKNVKRDTSSYRSDARDTKQPQTQERNAQATSSNLQSAPKTSARSTRSLWIQKHSIWIASLAVLLATICALVQSPSPDPIARSLRGLVKAALYPIEFHNPECILRRPWRKVWVSTTPKNELTTRDSNVSIQDWLAENRLVMHAIIGEGILARSEDGGTTWEVVWYHPESPLSSFCFVDDSRRGWCVGGGYGARRKDPKDPSSPIHGGSYGLLLSTSNSGKTWDRLTDLRIRPSGSSEEDGLPLESCCLNSVWFTDPNTGWIAGYHAVDTNIGKQDGSAEATTNPILAKTTDGGRTWTQVPFVVLPEMKARPIRKEAWRSPLRQERGRTHDTASVIPASTVSWFWLGGSSPLEEDKVGPGVKGDRGQGQHADPVIPPAVLLGDLFSDSCLECVYFADAVSGCIAGERGGRGFVLQTLDGGKSWREVMSFEDTAKAVYVRNAEGEPEVWAIRVNEPGSARIHRQSVLTPGQAAKREPTPTSQVLMYSPETTWKSEEMPARLQCLKSPDGRSVWAAGSFGGHGAVVRLDTEQKGYEAFGDRNAQSFESVHFLDPNLAVIVGATKEQRDLRYVGLFGAEPIPTLDRIVLRSAVRIPAPWYCVALLLTSGFPFWVRLFFRSDDSPSGKVEEVLVSDGPIESIEDDMFNFAPLAQGISGFIRNENTKPPLTIAVTAPWGGGKSSLLRLIEADLKEYRYQPVWVNAWHHRREEDFLAALLEHIRLEAVPSMWHPRGWAFRTALVAIRTTRNWPFVSFLLAFLLITVLLAPEGPVLLDFPRWKEMPLPAYLFTGGLAAGLVAIWRAASVFGISAALLLGKLTNLVRLKSSVPTAGFRQAFAAQFADFARALRWSRQTRPVIVIDDLDRCHPDRVLDVLESINFLSSCAQGFVLLGLDIDRVRDCITDGYKASLRDDRSIDPTFADRYLEKIINIRIPVPDIKPHEFEKLVRDKPSKRGLLRALVQSLPRRIPSFSSAAVVGAIVSYALFSWYSQGTPPPVARDNTDIMVARGGGQGGAPPIFGSVPESVPDPNTGKRAAPAKDTQVAQSPPNATLSKLMPAALSAAIVAFLIYLFANHRLGWQVAVQENVLTRDSRPFTGAVKAWLPMLDILRQGEDTPRSLKRFINEARFLAMRDRVVEPGDGANRESVHCPPQWLVTFHAAASFYGPMVSDRNQAAEFWETTVSRFPGDPDGTVKSIEDRIRKRRLHIEQERAEKEQGTSSQSTERVGADKDKARSSADQVAPGEAGPRNTAGDEMKTDDVLDLLKHQRELLDKVKRSDVQPTSLFPKAEGQPINTYRHRYLELREMAEFAGVAREPAD